MKVAIPIWNGRVSPVMDTACRLLVVDFADGREVSRETWDIPQVIRFGGDVDEIIAAYAGGALQNDNYRLPGCGRQRRQGRGQYRGQRTGFGRYKQFKEE